MATSWGSNGRGASTRERWALAAILLLAAALRIPALDETPPGLFCDEAAIATTAYAIGTTGRDLVGETLPLYSEQRAFERWGQYDIITQPVFQYWSIPFVLVGGLDVFSSRLAAAVLGLLAIPGTFLLGSALFDRRVGLAAAFLLALSPWHMHFSRVGFEAIALPTLLAYAAWLGLRGFSNRGCAMAATLVMALTPYSYPVALVFAPLGVLVFLLSQRKLVREHWRGALACLALLAVLQLPNLATMSQRGRAADVAISSAELSGEAAVELLERHSDSPIARGILEQRALLLPFVFAYSYASYLGPSFLLLDGDPNPRHGSTQGGVLHRFTAPLLLIGLVVLIARRRQPASQLLLGWLLVFPVGASLTTGGPHAIRAIVALPVLQIVAALGAVALWQAARDPAPRSRPLTLAAAALGAVLLLAVPLESGAFLHHYHTQYRIDSATWWQTGVGEALREAERRRAGYDRVLVSASIFDAYAFVLFYAGIDFESLDTSADLNTQLEPFGYRILFPDEQTEVGGDSRDLVLVMERDDLSGVPWRPVAEFPDAQGRPHLRLIELGPPRRPQ